MSEITINNEKKTIADSDTITSILGEMKIDVSGIAVAVNSQVIRKNKWAEFNLSDGDKVLVIKAAQGG